LIEDKNQVWRQKMKYDDFDNKHHREKWKARRRIIKKMKEGMKIKNYFRSITNKFLK
jgi:hypothetical protein